MSSNLSPTDCFVLQSGNSMFTWIGNASSYEQQQWAAKVAEFLKVWNEETPFNIPLHVVIVGKKMLWTLLERISLCGHLNIILQVKNIFSNFVPVIFLFFFFFFFFYFANYDHIQIPKCPLESRKFKGLKTTMSSVLGNFYRNSKWTFRKENMVVVSWFGRKLPTAWLLRLKLIM